MAKPLTPEEKERRAKEKLDRAVDRQRTLEANRLSKSLHEDAERVKATDELKKKLELKAAERQKKIDDEAAARRIKAIENEEALRKKHEAEDAQRAKVRTEKRIEEIKNEVATKSKLQKKASDKSLADAAKAAGKVAAASQTMLAKWNKAPSIFRAINSPAMQPTNFKPNAAKSLRAAYNAHLLAPAAMGLPPLPHIADNTPAFTIPQQSLGTRLKNQINALTGGHMFRPGAPPPPDGPPKGPNTIDSLIEGRNNIAKAQRGGILDKIKMVSEGGAGAVGAAAAIGGGVAAMGALGAAVGLLKTVLMATWDYMDTKVLPTQSKLNRALGATTPGMASLRKESMATALQFERLGLGFEHGADIVRTLAVNLKTAEIPKGLTTSLVKMSEYTGMGAENAGKLARSFMSTGETTETLGTTLDSVMVDAGNVAKQFAVPANLVREQWGEGIDLVQRWGTTNTHAMNVAIAKAGSYNMTLRQMENIFGKNLDTFENSSDMAAKLNASLGTNIDSIKLLNMNSDERMEYVRSQVLNTGFAWNSASKFAKNLLVSITGVKDEAEAADIFGSQDQRDKAMKRIAMQKQVTSGLDEWKNALGSLGTQLTSIEQLTRRFFMAIGNVIAKFLGFNDSIDMTKKGVKAFENFMDSLTNKINEFAASMPKREGGFGAAAIDWVNDFSSRISRARDTFRDFLNMLEDKGQLFEGDASSLSVEYENMRKDPTKYSDAEKQDLLKRLNERPLLQFGQPEEAYRKIKRDTGEDANTVRRVLDAQYDAQKKDVAAKLVEIDKENAIQKSFETGNIYLVVQMDSDVVAAAHVNKGLKGRPSSANRVR